MNCLMLTAGIKIFILDLGHLKKGKWELRENKIKRNNSLIDNFMKDLGDNLPQYKHIFQSGTTPLFLDIILIFED